MPLKHGMTPERACLNQAHFGDTGALPWFAEEEEGDLGDLEEGDEEAEGETTPLWNEQEQPQAREAESHELCQWRDRGDSGTDATQDGDVSSKGEEHMADAKEPPVNRVLQQHLRTLPGGLESSNFRELAEFTRSIDERLGELERGLERTLSGLRSAVLKENRSAISDARQDFGVAMRSAMSDATSLFLSEVTLLFEQDGGAAVAMACDTALRSLQGDISTLQCAVTADREGLRKSATDSYLASLLRLETSNCTRLERLEAAALSRECRGEAGVRDLLGESARSSVAVDLDVQSDLWEIRQRVGILEAQLSEGTLALLPERLSECERVVSEQDGRSTALDKQLAALAEKTESLSQQQRQLMAQQAAASQAEAAHKALQREAQVRQSSVRQLSASMRPAQTPRCLPGRTPSRSGEESVGRQLRAALASPGQSPARRQPALASELRDPSPGMRHSFERHSVSHFEVRSASLGGRERLAGAAPALAESSSVRLTSSPRPRQAPEHHAPPGAIAGCDVLPRAASPRAEGGLADRGPPARAAGGLFGRLLSRCSTDIPGAEMHGIHTVACPPGTSPAKTLRPMASPAPLLPPGDNTPSSALLAADGIVLRPPPRAWGVAGNRGQPGR